MRSSVKHPDQYNFDKETCDRCGITKAEAKKFPVDTGINHPQYRYTTSFYLGNRGEVHCARCHREMELEMLFAAMDRRDKERNANVKGGDSTCS